MQLINNNLDYMIDPIFRNVDNRLFLFSVRVGDFLLRYSFGR